jgi:hypothetical protein
VQNRRRGDRADRGQGGGEDGGQGVGSWMPGRRQQVLISENFEQSAALDLVVESNWGRSGHV